MENHFEVCFQFFGELQYFNQQVIYRVHFWKNLEFIHSLTQEYGKVYKIEFYKSLSLGNIIIH